MIAFDTEDDSQGTVTIVNFFDGQNHVTYRGEDCRFKAWGYIHAKQPEMYWGANCAYDLYNLFGSWLGKVCTLQYVGSGLMRGTYRFAKATFYDTWRHWPATVEKMGEAIGLPKLEMPHLGCNCDDCVDYCRRDTEITWRFVSEMLSRYEALGLFKLKATLPAMALELFKQFYTKEFCRLDDYYLNAFKKAYYGGRVEAYHLGVLHGVKHYDVNSLFPSVMVSNNFPDTDGINITNKPSFFEREGIFEGSVFIPRSFFPCLPVRDAELIFPYGQVSGSWPYPEIRQLLNDGGDVVSCREAIEFDSTESPFTSYIKFCYGKRLEAKTELDKMFWKLTMNSLYGKFGQNRGLDIIHDDIDTTIDAKAKHANVVWSAYVTSYARLSLLRFLRSCSTCFYTDTDSLFSHDTLETSAELGALKLEATYKEWETKGCKLWRGDDEYKVKGVKKEAAKGFFHTGRTTIKRPVRFREARRYAQVENSEIARKRSVANIWIDYTKEIRKEYTKRKVFKDGSTEPWNILEYHQFRKGL